MDAMSMRRAEDFVNDIISSFYGDVLTSRVMSFEKSGLVIRGMDIDMFLEVM